MNNDYKFNLNENFMWISILGISILSYFLNTRFALLIFFWLIIIIINGNIKRIYSKKYINFTMILRRSLYVIPLFFPLLLCFKITFRVENILIWNIMGLIIGLLFLLPKIKTWRIFLNREFIAITKKNIKMDYVTQWFMYFFGSLGEEIFFRAFIIEYISDGYPVLAILLSTCIFFLNHFGLKWSTEFSFYDYVIEILFGLVSSCLFLAVGSVLPSIIMHITYNSPYIIKSFKEYKYHYRDNKY